MGRLFVFVFTCPLVGLISAGCSRAWMGDFINGTERKLTLELYGETTRDGSRTVAAAALPPGARQRLALQRTAIVRDASGAVLYERNDLFTPPPIPTYTRPGEGLIRFVLLDDGLYPVPRKWRNDWRQHTTEIRAVLDHSGSHK